MKLKINSKYTQNTQNNENDIYRKFSIEFESLFSPDDIAKNDQEFDDIYVHDYDFERSLSSLLSSKVSMAKFCVGYTGIGKTTSIRYCLDLKTRNTPFLNTKRRMVVFPTFLDGYRLEEMENFDLSKRVSSVCRKFETEYPDLREYMRTYEGKKEFYDFMYNHNDFALENLDYIESMDLPEEEYIKLSLNEAYKKDEFIFHANRLKFYIKKKQKDFGRLVILLDDIETLPQEWQRKIIKKFLKLFDCMKNTDYDSTYIYNINLLISMRPHTHRFLYGDRDIEAYPLSNPILKTVAVDLSDLFKKRFDFYSKKYRTKNTIGNISSWKYCYDEVMKMNSAFDGKYKIMIQKLCFFNIRESLSVYAKVFSNRFWIQKNKPKADAFSVLSDEYNFNNINVIRALACNENSVFFATKESYIPNIFFTTRNYDYTIPCLLIMKYFIEKRDGDDYGINSQELKSIKEEFSSVFTNNYVEIFVEMITYLFENKILRKSIFDSEDMSNIEIIEEKSKLYISPRGNELFEMLSRDSVLFELLRECSWREYENREYSFLSSYELTKTKDYIIIYRDLLEYIEYLCEKEDEIYSEGILRDKYQNFHYLFGDTPMVTYLLDGVIKSIKYIEDEETKKEINRRISITSKKILELNKYI